MNEEMSSPSYHHEIHRKAYDTTSVMGGSGEAAFLTIELDEVLYPSDSISPFATSTTKEGGFYQAQFVYDFAPEDPIVAPWIQERTVLEVVHTRAVTNLGWLAARSATTESYDLTVKNIYLKRMVKQTAIAPDVITNDYSITRYGNKDPFYMGAVRRSNFQLGEKSDFELMTEYDAEQLFEIVYALHRAIDKRLVFGN